MSLTSIPFTANASTTTNTAETELIFVVLDGKTYETTESKLPELLQNLNVTKSILSDKEQSALTEPILNNDDSVSVNSSFIYYWFDLTYYNSNTYRSDLNRRISTVIYNDTADDAQRTITYTASQGIETNASVSFGIKDYMEAEAGTTFSSSESEEDSITFTIPRQNYGWMDYYPIMENVRGYFCSEQYIDGYGWHTTSTAYSK